MGIFDLLSNSEVKLFENNSQDSVHSCTLLPFWLAELVVKSQFKSPLYYNGEQLPNKEIFCWSNLNNFQVSNPYKGTFI